MPRQNANVKSLIDENNELKKQLEELRRLASEQKAFINS